MFSKIVLIVFIIYILNSFKYFYPLEKINFLKGNEPIIWYIDDKKIFDIVSITFLFKFDNFSDSQNDILSFGKNYFFFDSIKINKIIDKNSKFKYYLNLNEKINNQDFELINNEYYYVHLEISKKKVDNFYYLIQTKLNYGKNYHDKVIVENSQLLDNYVSFESFFFNIGCKTPYDLANFNFSIENLTAYSRQWSNFEKRNLIKGGSKVLLFLDFAYSWVYSQYFYNRINNCFLGAINGSSINNDENDLFYDYQKVSNNTIKKKLLIFNMNQYILLPQEIIKYLYEFDISNYTVFLKVSLNLNNQNFENLNINYKLYNRNNKSGMNINLLKINENLNKKFEFKINLIEDEWTGKNFISNQEFLNINYLILRYEKIYSLDLYMIYFTFNIDNQQSNFIFTQTINNFLSNDNHYIGDFDGLKLNKTYLLIELEDFMIGKGTLITNMFTKSKNMIFDNVSLLCNKIKNNKINREKVKYVCKERKEIIKIRPNCEYYKKKKCVFYLPEYNKNIRLRPNIIIIKPYRQIFRQNPKINTNYNIIKRKGNNFFELTYLNDYCINNNWIIEIYINNNNIISDIFQIEFNYKKYSSFFIDKNNFNTKLSVEIFNSQYLCNPNIKLINLFGDEEFKINSIILVEVEDNKTIEHDKKFIGEKISNYYVLKKRLQFSKSLDIKDLNYRESNSIAIKCHPSCNKCTGPNNKNCIACNTNYINFRNFGCIKINAKNCLINGNNPSYCLECKNDFKKEIIDTNRVNCLCSYFCKDCFNSKYNSCLRCYKGFILYENNICKPFYENIKCEPNHYFKCKEKKKKKYNNLCLKCGEGCNSCLLNDKIFCNNCLTGYHLLNNKCIRCKQDGYFININKKDINNQPICDFCHNSCKNCSTNKINNCLKCYDGYYLLKINENESICSPCNMKGYFKNKEDCLKCDENCLNCENDSKFCTSCKNNFLLDVNKKNCVLKCRKGTFLKVNKCIKCKDNCKNCSNELTCNECDDGFFLDEYKKNCSLCNKLNNIIINNKCLECHKNCRTCNNINHNNCLSCNKDFNLYGKLNSCTKNCPPKTFKIKMNESFYCKDCYKGCLKCFNDKKNGCIKCENDLLYNEYTKTCSKNCLKGYYKSGNKCKKCKSNCLKCNSKNHCFKCKKLYFLNQNNKCSFCNHKNYFIKNEKCYKCSNNCLSCLDYDNCLSCKPNKLLVFNKNINKYYCKSICKFKEVYESLTNSCTDCKNCKNCQFKNNFICKDCSKCNKKCEFDFRFNETGLYLFNESNNYIFNNTNIMENNKKLIELTKSFSNGKYFKINENNDLLDYINLNFTSEDILKSLNCTFKYKNLFIEIKKTFDKICKIENINYDLNKNLLNIKFNFKINESKINENFSYKITNTNSNIIKYYIYNITYLNENEINFHFIPNYFKKYYNITLYFNNSIIKKINCKSKDFIKKKYLINSKEVLYYESDLILNYENLTTQLNEDDPLIKKLDKIKPMITLTKKSIISIIIFSSIFSSFLNLIIRFFQIVYILDFIFLLKINWGDYTNIFVNYFDLNIKLHLEFNNYLGINLNYMQKKIIKILYSNSKLIDSEFIYLTDFNIEFLMVLGLIFIEVFFEILSKMFLKFKKRMKIVLIKNYFKKKNFNQVTSKIKLKENKIIKNIKKELKKNNKIISYIMFKIKSLKLTFIGKIFPNVFSTILIYSGSFYNFNFLKKNDIILVIIYIIYYFIIIYYIKEVVMTIIYHKKYNKQKRNYQYRNKLFIFNNKEKGLHNYVILITLLRDILIIFIGILVNIRAILQAILFLLVQLVFFIIILFVRSKYDYKNIQIFKLQEFLNLVLILTSLILYFTKFELFQFIFIIIFMFQLLISILNLFYNIFTETLKYLIFFYTKIKVMIN